MTSAAGRGRGPLEQARGRVVERLRVRRSEIDEAIFARVRDLAPGAVGLGDSEYVEGLRAASTAAVDFVLEGLEQRGWSSPQIPSAAMVQARRAARIGVGLDTVLRRYVAGLAVLEDFVMQEAHHEDFMDQRTALRGVLGTSALLLDRLIPSITSAYMQEAERAGRSSGERDGIPVPGLYKQGSHRVGEQGSQRVGSARGEGRSAGSPGQGTQAQSARTSRRDRILQAMVEVVAERGFGGVSVRLVTGRAGVSGRTFYECFDGLEGCFTAVMDQATERAGILIMQAFARERSWRDGMRAALAALLVFFDSEPLLARVWLVEVLAAGSWALEHRERKIALLSSMIVEHWSVPGTERPEALAIAGVMASLLGLIHTHLVTKEPGPLIELLGPLMGLVTTPYLDARDVAREIESGEQLARAIRAGEHPLAPAPATAQDMGPGVVLPEMLANPTASRARECLRFLAEHPDSSNREIAVGIGVAHQSQVSRLLAYFTQEGLVVKRSEGVGKRNASRLTRHGEEIVRALVEWRN
jgi:AcrR family transcriptional regulator